ncbi:hypothetical protein SASPL_154312 [Salvia splendens]|uniref:Uncharacterized protein n=1 Tax=Salvia splendens TaxID=180675 RepID=A0A8X8VZT9_SALSN|nr:hypothetical protein SASPL_154312 [Salvia splendens]
MSILPTLSKPRVQEDGLLHAFEQAMKLKEKPGRKCAECGEVTCYHFFNINVLVFAFLYVVSRCDALVVEAFMTDYCIIVFIALAFLYSVVVLF